MVAEKRLSEHLVAVYGKETAQFVFDNILRAIKLFKLDKLQQHIPDLNSTLTEKDIILITYGDFINKKGEAPLQTLTHFLEDYLQGRISIIHILPFYPYSSDDGFSVIDYWAVNKKFGTWADLHQLAKKQRLMVDAVINHISSQSEWFKGFLAGDDRYRNYFITNADIWDLSKVVRPRTSELLTDVETVLGIQRVWTTFSADQVDLNYENPQVFIEIIKLILFYVKQGASVIRLDAIAYMWKESGTSCIHLPQTHHLIKAIRAVLDMISPGVILITETNVPHQENISYFGEIDEETGIGDEAHMVYQFPLAPLVLHTLIAGKANKLNDWVESLEPSGYFMNFIASHDGIGMMPALGLLDTDEINMIIQQVLAHGGLVSNKSNPDGSETVYELNTTLYDALNDPYHPDMAMDLARFMASQMIMLSLAGVPGIYFHSLLGSHNALAYAKETGQARSINRKNFQLEELEKLLQDPSNTHRKVFDAYLHMLTVRTSESAFHPRGDQQILRVSEKVFALERVSPDKASSVLALINVTNQNGFYHLKLTETSLGNAENFYDLITKKQYSAKKGILEIKLSPYQGLWLKAVD